MSLFRRREFIWSSSAFLALSAGGTLPRPAIAESNYPTKPVRIIEPFSAGTLTDVLCRKVGQILGERLGQAFFVDNRVGASGQIGLNILVDAKPDGYTLGYGSLSTLVLYPIFNPARPFRPEAALQPACFLGEQVFALVVARSMEVKTLSELIAKLKAEPNKYNYGSPGIGLMQHLLGEIFKKNAGVQMTHVPFSSDSLSFQGVVSGTVQMAFANFALYRGLLDKVNILAIASNERSPQLPDVPTFEEQGIYNMNRRTWHGLFAPIATPRSVIDRINNEVEPSLSSESMREFYQASGLIQTTMSIDAFTARIKDDIASWTRLVPELGVKLN